MLISGMSLPSIWSGDFVKNRPAPVLRFAGLINAPTAAPTRISSDR
jgi:hypothetical protein